MIRTGYALGMSTTPSDPDYINEKALKGVVRSFDTVLNGQFDLAPRNVDTNVDLKVLKVQCREQDERLEREALAQVSFWYRFPLFKAICCFKDRLRLRKYNEEWIKNNIR
jgi:hypothetical protein